MTIYRGLNVFKTLNDVDDKNAALENLGLNQKDLTLIAGLSRNKSPVSKNDIHFIAGLREDQVKSMFSLASSSSSVSSILSDLSDIGQPLNHNFDIDGQLATAGVKFNYVNFDELHENSLSSGDVSTSRVSAWSLLGTTLVYGGEVTVTGNTLRVGSLATSVAPLPKTFRSEIPTHTIKMNVKSGKEGTGDADGNEHEFIAMKGIPITFTSNFRNAIIGHVITPIQDNYKFSSNDQTGSPIDVPATWRITNDDGASYNSGDGTVDNPGVLGNGTSGGGNIAYKFSYYFFADSSSKRRKVEFFYDPAKTVGLSLNSINLNSWPQAVVSGLKRLEIANNDFFKLPSFGGVETPVNEIFSNLDGGQVVSVGSLLPGFQYTIITVGGTTGGEWNTAAGTTGGTYSAGTTFSAAAVGATLTGTAGTAIMTALDTRLATKEISAVNFIVGEVYEITDLGIASPGGNTQIDAAQAIWNTAAGTTGVTYVQRDDTTTPKTQGSIFTAKAAGSGTGKAIVSKHGTLPLSGLAPALEEIDMSLNNLSRAIHADGTQVVANHQLNTLPLSLQKLKMFYTFKDSTEIDLLNYKDLTHFDFDNRLGNQRRLYRTMPYVSNTHVSPKVSTSIKRYFIRGHKYALLASGVCASPDLEYIYISDTDMTGPEVEVVAAANFIPGTTYRVTDTGDMNQAAWEAVGGTNSTPSATYAAGTTFTAIDPQPASTGTGKARVSVNITIVSDNISRFYSLHNKHGVVSMNGKSKLTHYYHYNADMTYIPVNDRELTSATFTGCTQLRIVHLAYSSLLTGDANIAFKDLQKLSYLNFIRTNLKCELSDDTFSEDCNLERLYIDGSGLIFENNHGIFGVKVTPEPADNPNAGLQIFYNTPKLRIVRATNNKNITGELPDFIKNTALQRVFIAGTSMNGSINVSRFAPAVSSLILLNLYNNNFSGVGAFFTLESNIFTRLRFINFSKNRINTTIGPESIKGCPALVEFNISNNKRPASSDSVFAATTGFSGQVPDFSTSPNLEGCYLSDNSIKEYVAGSLSTNLALTELDISNNQLTLQSARILLNDLYINYTNRNRSGVVIDIRGNNLTELNLIGNSESRKSALDVLRGTANWIFTV